MRVLKHRSQPGSRPRRSQLKTWRSAVDRTVNCTTLAVNTMLRAGRRMSGFPPSSLPSSGLLEKLLRCCIVCLLCRGVRVRAIYPSSRVFVTLGKVAGAIGLSRVCGDVVSWL